MIHDEHVRAFVETIFEWFATHKRTLPWRDIEEKYLNHKAYLVLVSEIMLQQTQVPRVIIAYKNFIQTFPSITELSKASNSQIIMAWRGMGYNNRALRLRDAARTIIQEHGGVFPSDMDALQSISGIGHYTAAAVRNFAFNIPTACLDTNIRRILHRVFIGPENRDGSWKKDDAYVLKIAEEVLACAMEHGSAADWHAALMDYGSLVCTKRNPKWNICPLTKNGLMKAAHKVVIDRSPKITKREPGRMVGSKFVPNRIFRGRIVDALRDANDGLALDVVGERITLDWSPKQHRQWLKDVAATLERDGLIVQRKGLLRLA